MKIKMNAANKVSLIIGIAYLAYVTGIAQTMVGEMPECSPDPYTFLCLYYGRTHDTNVQGAV